MLVDETGQVKVLDFGIAQLSQRQRQEATGGTLGYMAPEVLQGSRPSECADLYAVGIMAYEVLIGRHPFELGDLRKLMYQIVNEMPDLADLEEITLILNGSAENVQPPDIAELSTPALAPVLTKLLAKNPADRYQIAHTVIQDLYKAIQEPLPQEHATIRESFLQAALFVGRQQEFTLLAEGMETAATGQSAAWLIGGESGVGKSRLLDELRIAALVKGGLVLRGQAVAEGGLRYQLWRDVLPRLILATEVTDFEASVLYEVVPQIGILIGREVFPLAPLTGNGQHQRLSQTICDLFLRQTRLTVLLLEDLQWTNEKSRSAARSPVCA